MLHDALAAHDALPPADSCSTFAIAAAANEFDLATAPHQ